MDGPPKGLKNLLVFGRVWVGGSGWLAANVTLAMDMDMD